MVKVYETPEATLVVRTKGLKQAKSPLVGAGKKTQTRSRKRASNKPKK